ncbi:hypothetical protein BC835DRAFT_1293675 [Cytidiella melzeri]|nr:hypothetical protein BC835DRAFT_1293675 [Cytidiella melzeri]
MPLPPNGILSLQGHVGPGGTESSKPKQAMIVRMSAETFEALEAQPTPPKLEVEFGDNPGIFIGDAFFSMRPHQESSPHELYIRAVPANKTTAPLKLHANVTGKFMVDRQLGSRVESLIKDKTVAAEKQRTERKTIMLNAPPPTAPPVKAAKKKPTITKKYPAVESTRSLSASSSAQPSRMVSPRPPTLQAKELVPSRLSPRPPVKRDSDRGRLVHFLALNPRTLGEVMRSVGGVEEDQPIRPDLFELLKAVATLGAKLNTTGPSKWLLKQKTWLEVKPFTFPDLSQQERLKLAKKAQSAFQNMGIPESDPRWNDIRPPSGTSSGTSRAGPSTASSADTRRPAASQEAHVKEVKADAPVKMKVAASDLPAKIDSARLLKMSKYKDSDSDAMSSTTASKAPTRRVPGSGFKMKAGSDTPPTPDLTSSNLDSGRKPQDVRAAKAENQSSSANRPSHHSASAPPPQPHDGRPPITHNASTTRVPQAVRDSHERARPADPMKERARDSPAPSLKRKKALQDDQESALSEREASVAHKRRRMEEQGSERYKERDLSLPKKPVMREPSPPSRNKQSKYDGRSPIPTHSPLPIASSPRISPLKQSHHERAPSFSSNRSRDDAPHRSGSAKPRRKSPVYTSSEDEKEQPRRRTDTSRRDDQRHERLTTTVVKKLGPIQISLPDSPEVLKKIYTRRWLIYQSLHARHAALVDEIRELLRDGAEEVYLPDGDPGLPHPDELAKLRADLDEEEKTLHTIVEKWEGLRRQGKIAEESLAIPNKA